jgi:hypothetical protein
MAKVRYEMFVISFLLGLMGCVTVPKEGARVRPKWEETQEQRAFLKVLQEDPQRIFSEKVPAETKMGLRDFEEQVKLPNGLVYGEIMRSLKIRGKQLDELELELAEKKCVKKIDVLKHPSTQSPVLFSGAIVPIWIYVCPDGGLVKLKVKGDPTNRFRPEPHGIKAMRYPASKEETSFDHERFKVDEAGYAIPKWRKDLGVERFSESDRDALVEGWAEDAHLLLYTGI